MKQYTIPILYQKVEEFTVEAENLQEAVTIALKTFLSITDDNYIDNSFQIDDIIDDNYSSEEYDLNEALKNLI